MSKYLIEDLLLAIPRLDQSIAAWLIADAIDAMLEAGWITPEDIGYDGVDRITIVGDIGNYLETCNDFIERATIILEKASH